MDQMEKIVQLVTDRLLSQLEQKTEQPTIAFYGPKNSKVLHFYEQKGYREADTLVSVPEVVVVTEMPLFTLTRLANLAPQGKDEEKLLKRLFKQQTTFIVEEGLEYQNPEANVPKMMKPVFDRARIDLQKWGASFVNLTYFDGEKTAGSLTQKSSASAKKELITATKIQNLKLRSGDHFVVTPNMIITALAKDYLRDQGISIEMRDA